MFGRKKNKRTDNNGLRTTINNRNNTIQIQKRKIHQHIRPTIRLLAGPTCGRKQRSMFIPNQWKELLIHKTPVWTLYKWSRISKGNGQSAW